jgi:hypothetical protein
MSRSWQSDVQLKYQTNKCSDNRDDALINARIIHSCDNAWIINSFYFGYRSPIRSDYETTLSIRYEYFGSEIRTNPIGSDSIGFGSDLHTSSLQVAPVIFYKMVRKIQLKNRYYFLTFTSCKAFIFISEHT